VHVVRRVYGGLGGEAFVLAGFFVASLSTLFSPSPLLDWQGGGCSITQGSQP